MILSAQTIRALGPIEPFEERGVIRGRSYGLSAAGYDIRVAEDITLMPGQFSLASSVERFTMPADVLARGRRWRENNPEKQKEINRISNEKRRSTVKGKLEQFVRSGIWKAISRGGKNGRKTMELLGYSVDKLKRHIEKQFHPGMTWENYGEWHIDHIIPLAAHNYETPDDIDFKKAWALKNLQPLWALDNISKKDLLETEFQPSLAMALPANDNKESGSDVA